jgi:Ca2+-binding RTX toxin-like protein
MAGTTELIYMGNLNKAGYGPVEVYVNVGYEPYPEGFNPLPDSAFSSYVPDPGYSLNTSLRTPLFTGPFLSSPLLPDGEYEYITDSQGYTWLYNTFNYMAIEPFNQEDYDPGITRYSAALVAPAPPGSIQLVINDKNQPQTFAARDEAGRLIDYCFATDPNGNVFIVGSVDTAYAEDPVAAFRDAKLPKGWTKQVKSLEQDLTIEPGAGAGHRNVYNQFRDNLTNNFFQIEFAANGIGIARGVPGLPLSGGVSSDLILGTRLDELIYGAQGNDRLKGFAGDDQIWGDAGDDLIRPGRGDDQLWGGSGRDVFRVSQGAKTIHDFSVSEGDRLRFAALIDSVRSTSDGVEIQAGSSSALLLGVDRSDLQIRSHEVL